MAKMRVYELAKQTGILTADLVKSLNELDIPVKNHLSAIEDKDVERFLISIEKTKEQSEDIKKETENLTEEKVPKSAKKVHRQKEHKENVPALKIHKTEPFPEEEKITEIIPTEKPANAIKESVAPMIEVKENSTVKEFAQILDKPSSDVIKKLIALGEMITINQSMGNEAIKILSEEFGYEANIILASEETKEKIVDLPEDLKPRPPVITIMGHVDHGKTSLLDAIRKTDVISGEAGGITQHIGAYQIDHNGKKITFIDTPGHEAFTAMRARGAKITDVAVLVVAADDGVMPQTVEAIDHARAAKVPILVAVNKIDKPGANLDNVKKELAEHNLTPEEWGGDTVFVSVSAKQKINIDDLLEMIILIADLQELKANPNCSASGVTIEAKLDKGRGPVATILIQRGILRIGDSVVAGTAYGKVRAMYDDKGRNVTEATPSQPVEVLGFSSVPRASDFVKTVKNEREAKQIVEERVIKAKLLERKTARKHITLEDLFNRIKEGEIQDLNLVIKGDVQGSVEALEESLLKLDQDEVKINIIHKGVGAISETDVMLASASNAIIIGFNVRPESKAREMAVKENVDMRMYRVIYKVVEDINAARVGMLKPEFEEVERGRVEIRETFKVPKIGVIGGSFVTEGEVARNDQVRLVRDGIIVHEGTIASLRRFKDDVHSVKSGFECGIGLEGFQDIKVGDVVEAFILKEKART